MKEILLKSLKLYGKCVLGGIMCFFLVITLNVIETALFTEVEGYKAYGVKEGAEQVELYTHYYKDGDDTKKQEYIDKGYTVNEFTFRSEINPKTARSWNMVSEIFLIFMMGVFVYNELWNLGFKDYNSVKIGIKKENKFKGLQIGLLTTAPSIVLLTVLVIGKATFTKNLSIALYAFLNPHLYEAIMLFTNGGGYISTLQWWQIIVFYALLAFVPLIAYVAYLLGYKSILVSEKLIYKKN